MRQWHKIAIGMFIAGAFGAAAYCEFVFDLRTPRSALQSRHLVDTSSTYLLEDVRLRSLELEKMFGVAAHTTIGPRGILTTKVDGTIVHREKMAGDFSQANGLFVVGSRTVSAAIFPFELGRNTEPKNNRRALTDSLNTTLRNLPRAQSSLTLTRES